MSAGGQSKLMGVIRVSSGNFLEQYDFFVFGYFAAAIGRTFFPQGNVANGDFISLMLALMTFGAGFLMRPIGALVLGAYIDAHGRRAGLILTLALMSVGTLAIAIVPGYATLGLAAPLLVVISRLIQGFSAGVELGGVSVYLAEIATPGNKGFYVAWQSGSQQVAVIFAALLGVALNQTLGSANMQAWGWRIPLLIGCAIIPFLFWLRSSLLETETFLTRKRHLTAGEIVRSMATNWRIIVLGMAMVIMTTVSFYLITAYTPTFGKQVLKLGDIEVLIVTVCVGVSNLFWLPVSGALSDRIGRRPLLIGTTVLAIVTAYPVMSWLVANPTFGHLLIAELWLSFLYGCYNGAMVVYLTEIMPVEVRTAGFSLAYSLATVIGGMTPAICTGLIEYFGDKAAPGAWMALAAVVGLGAVLLIGRDRAPYVREVHA
ncbi:MFS transporter [Acidisphaera sp. L21]|jgi:MFS family permease|uniref:MFS transporter n=1 Tax=Acidisphaera sp. L21 TaxID=1641851 RepID=UPI00131BE16C|nr:MFS transporter [Acidisphaera sp. L21]